MLKCNLPLYKCRPEDAQGAFSPQVASGSGSGQQESEWDAGSSSEQQEPEDLDDVELDKSNVLMLGPTGGQWTCM